MEEFLEEQKLAQAQMDKNNSVMEELFWEWKKYPDGKPVYVEYKEGLKEWRQYPEINQPNT